MLMHPHEARTTRQRDHKCIGFSEALEQQREKQEARTGPQPWILRKLTVGVVVAILGYVLYVYLARFCVPMIRKIGNIGSRTTGIAFTVVFSLLFFMFIWSYAKIVFTSPGYAHQFVSKTPPPAPQPQDPYRGSWESDESITGTPYNATAPASRSQSRPSVEIPTFSPSHSPSRSPHRSPHPQRSPHPSRSPPHSRQNTHDIMTQVRPSHRPSDSETGPLDALPPITARRAINQSHPRPPPPAHNPQGGNGSNMGLPPPLYSRRPPTHPALAPEYRYCTRDGFIKPMRAHHCRACGTCVLKYDHHCPWIGQCVGAFNHKFFVNFLQWSTIFSAFVFATLIALNARASASGTTSVDPQHIVVIALAGIFTFFTLTLFISHVNLILLNASTVEHLGMQRMRERENGVLSQMTRLPCPCSSGERLPYGPPDADTAHSPFRVLVSRRRIKKQWDMEWGKIDTEGNLWWLGSKRANWEWTMGRSKLGWFLPIGRSLGDGLTYPTNPRFDRDGRWRRRTEWPDGLR